MHSNVCNSGISTENITIWLPLCSLETAVQTCSHSEDGQPEVEALCHLSSMATRVHWVGGLRAGQQLECFLPFCDLDLSGLWLFSEAKCSV